MFDGCEAEQELQRCVFYINSLSHDYYLAEMPTKANTENFSLCCHSDEHWFCVCNLEV